MIDSDKQDDTLRLAFKESDDLNAFVIISKEILNLNSFENDHCDLLLGLTTKKPLFVSIGCGFDVAHRCFRLLQRKTLLITIFL